MENHGIKKSALSVLTFYLAGAWADSCSFISLASKDAQAQFLQDVVSFHSSWYEVRLKQFRKSTEENQGRLKTTAA